MQLVGSLSGLEAEDVVVIGEYAYIANDRAQLAIVNIANPSAPALVGNVTPHGSGNAVSLAVSGDYAYVAVEADGLLIFDISQPTAPLFAGQFGPAYAKDVAVAGDYAYVADQDYGLRVVDVSNPSAPTLVGSASSDGPFGIAVSGNYAYCADNDSGMCIVDISNPAAPLRASQFTSSLSSTRDVAVQGNYVYLADDDEGPVIINVSNPSLPTLASRFVGDCLRLVVDGNFAYVAEGYPDGGVSVVNISSATSPDLADSCSTTSPTTGIAVDSNYVYVAADSMFLIYAKTTSSASLPWTGSRSVRVEQ